MASNWVCANSKAAVQSWVFFSNMKSHGRESSSRHAGTFRTPYSFVVKMKLDRFPSKCVFSELLLPTKFRRNQLTHLVLSIIVPLTKSIQTFLLENIILWTLLSTELMMNVSGTHNLSIASPPRMMVRLSPNASLGSLQKWPKYRSTEKSWEEQSRKHWWTIRRYYSTFCKLAL